MRSAVFRFLAVFLIIFAALPLAGVVPTKLAAHEMLAEVGQPGANETNSTFRVTDAPTVGTMLVRILPAST